MLPKERPHLLSAEAVYDRIVTDLRRYRKLMTLRGVGVGDMLERKWPPWWETRGPVFWVR